MKYETIITLRENAIGIITFNRPEQLNAISIKLREELTEAFQTMSNDDQIKAIILTGNEKAFAAGADIKEMQSKSYMDMYLHDNASKLQTVLKNCRKPIIAAVSGYALGGGCELAMMCDFILAAENAKFGQPEVSIGALPGWGGTQRLTGLIGKSKAMDMCLTGRMMDAREAEYSGLVSRVFPVEGFLDKVIEIATPIASNSVPVNQMIKECINQSLETNLQSGLLFEHRQFQAVFATEDQKEGMSAFVEKRKPAWKNY
ncbi:MAG: enoyl-CoA hydratase-related protein [Gammaproteobacteria bacterium]|nr:enoyl-CoA hydratase-related protein [Gammaproteobacteria bacterium]MCY4219420.1 enoyl-CoA hydratase-related protein [Gammaproteobacteria bacterium]MCY4274082.1 enoyl-CoA hydratase-related protein [Gammaproteobacteria bacterium]